MFSIVFEELSVVVIIETLIMVLNIDLLSQACDNKINLVGLQYNSPKLIRPFEF